MPTKFLVLGGIWGGGGWKCQFYFYGRGDLLKLACALEGPNKLNIRISRGGGFKFGLPPCTYVRESVKCNMAIGIFIDLDEKKYFNIENFKESLM